MQQLLQQPPLRYTTTIYLTLEIFEVFGMWQHVKSKLGLNCKSLPAMVTAEWPLCRPGKQGRDSTTSHGLPSTVWQRHMCDKWRHTVECRLTCWAGRWCCGVAAVNNCWQCTVSITDIVINCSTLIWKQKHARNILDCNESLDIIHRHQNPQPDLLTQKSKHWSKHTDTEHLWCPTSIQMTFMFNLMPWQGFTQKTTTYMYIDGKNVSRLRSISIRMLSQTGVSICNSITHTAYQSEQKAFLWKGIMTIYTTRTRISLLISPLALWASVCKSSIAVLSKTSPHWEHSAPVPQRLVRPVISLYFRRYKFVFLFFHDWNSPSTSETSFFADCKHVANQTPVVSLHNNKPLDYNYYCYYYYYYYYFFNPRYSVPEEA